jgi:hypothetical protein
VFHHRRAPAGAAQTIRDAKHADALERAILDSFTSAPRCKRKASRPPEEAALAAAARIRGEEGKEVAIVAHHPQAVYFGMKSGFIPEGKPPAS